MHEQMAVQLTCLSHKIASFCQVDLAPCHAAVARLLVAQAMDDRSRCFQKASWSDSMQVLHLQCHANCVQPAVLAVALVI